MRDDIGGVGISYNNFDDILESPYVDLINANLKIGVSPPRLSKLLKRKYKCNFNKTKVYDYRSKFFPEVTTIQGVELIESLSDKENNESKREGISKQSLSQKIMERMNDKLDSGDEFSLSVLAQTLGVLNRCDDTRVDSVPIEDVVDNQKALDIVLKGSKYDK